MSTERQVSASFVLPPNTQIVKLAVSGARHTAGVRFRGVGAGHTRFECKLDSRSFKPCRSPKTFRHLAPGRHSVRVRAVNEAGADKSPAKRTFTIPKPH
jgi:hypothetical protein